MKNRRAYPVQIVQVLHCISEKTTNTDLEPRYTDVRQVHQLISIMFGKMLLTNTLSNANVFAHLT